MISRHPAHVTSGRQHPTAVFLRAEQGREAGTRVETGQTQPVDRSVVAHQGDGLGVADQAVVLDAERHAASAGDEREANGATGVPAPVVLFTIAFVNGVRGAFALHRHASPR